MLCFSTPVLEFIVELLPFNADAPEDRLSPNLLPLEALQVDAELVFGERLVALLMAPSREVLVETRQGQAGAFRGLFDLLAGVLS
ncbi:hypothetical protein KOR34_19150 [Posidoniimonas corsicana]|uniref:Uncharacterized protein n=1 Tax=Posidoniimonas corsicana TaxID=1938618 RepID=A0A5C5VG98_9BACT|nr:hypothetical protein [Posidoniimonas corsicana]TWT36970.1 hypothetical protein KOR34_19150 [Posidoniimonas corsicana]